MLEKFAKPSELVHDTNNRNQQLAVNASKWVLWIMVPCHCMVALPNTFCPSVRPSVRHFVYVCPAGDCGVHTRMCELKKFRGAKVLDRQSSAFPRHMLLHIMRCVHLCNIFSWCTSRWTLDKHRTIDRSLSSDFRTGWCSCIFPWNVQSVTCFTSADDKTDSRVIKSSTQFSFFFTLRLRAWCCTSPNITYNDQHPLYTVRLVIIWNGKKRGKWNCIMEEMRT